MKKWLYALGGCLIGYLVKKKIDEHTGPYQVKDWPLGLKYKGDGNHAAHEQVEHFKNNDPG